MSKTDKFPNFVQQILKNNKLDLKPHDYTYFWEFLSEYGENNTLYIYEIIRQIIQSEGSKRSSKAASFPDLLCTLSTLFLFRRMSAEKKYHQILDLEKEWKTHEEKSSKRPDKCPFTKPIISTFFSYFLNQEEEVLLEMIISQLCMLPKDIPSVKITLEESLDTKDLKEFYIMMNSYFSRYDNYLRNEKDDNESTFYALYNQDCEYLNTSEFTFCYEYLISQLNDCKKKPDGAAPEIFFSLTREYLQLLPCLSTNYPEKAEKIATSILYLLKQIFTFYPINSASLYGEHDVIQSFINNVDALRRWPFPVGFLAHELMEVLFNESKTLGSAYRYKIREEIPAIDFLHNYSKKKEDEASSPLYAYCIFNEKKDKTMLSGILEQNSYVIENYPGQQITPHQMRVFMVIHIFFLHGKATSKFRRHIVSINEKDIFLIYCRLLNILEKTDELESNQDIKNIQSHVLDELLKEIFQMKTESSESKEKLLNLLNAFPCFTPTFPSHVLKPIDKRIYDENFQGESAGQLDSIGPMNPKEYSKVIKEIISEIRAVGLPLHQEALKLVIFGGDQELGILVNEIGGLFTTDPSTFRNVDFRVYLIPNKNNAMAKYIASKDFWYNKFIYIPFAEDVLLPRLDLTQDEVPLNPKKETYNVGKVFPFELKESLIQTYLREGVRVIKVKINEILCYKKVSIDTNRERKPDMVIYFSSYMEIGVSVEYEEKRNQKNYVGETFYDLKEKGALKFTAVDLEIKTISQDIEGYFLSDPETFRTQVHSLKINNVYREYFEGNTPIPTANWLELSYIDFENSKEKDKNLKKKMLFKKHSYENLQNAFHSLHSSLPVVETLIRQPENKGFKLLVDGEIYDFNGEGINEVIVRVKRNENNEICMLPLVTFLPVEL